MSNDPLAEPRVGCLTVRARHRALLAACAVLALLLGTLKLWVQHESPPDWARQPAHMYEGYVAIDGFADRAATIRDFLLQRGVGVDQLLDYWRHNLHATSIAVPLLVAVVSLAGLGIPTSYYLTCSAFFLVSLCLIVRICRRVASNGHAASANVDEIVFLAAGAVATHCLAHRTVGLLILDWACAMATLGTCLSAMVWTQSPSFGRWLLMGAWLLFGLLTKTSFLPQLAIPLLFAAFCTRSWRSCWLAGAAAGIPLAATAWAVYSIDGSWFLARDAKNLAELMVLSWRHAARFGFEMVLLLQVFPLLVRRTKPWHPEAISLAFAAILILASTWVLKMPTIPRLYLPAMVIFVPLAVVMTRTAITRPLLVGYLVVNLAISGVGLAIGG